MQGSWNTYRYYYQSGKEGIKVASEELWVERCLRGDPEAFSEIVHRYEAYVFAIVLNFVSNPLDAQDIAQNVMMQVYRSLPAYQTDNLKAWIGKIAVNKSIDWKRRQAARNENELLTDREAPSNSPGGRDDPEYFLIRREKQDQVQRTIASLPDHYRKVLLDYYFKEMSYQDIAVQEGLGIRAIESRLYRAKHLFRKKWGESEYEAF